MSYYDDNDYEYDAQRSGISDGTKQFLIIFFSIFGACHAIALFRRILNYGTFCSGKSPLAMERRTSNTPKRITEPLDERYEIGIKYDEDILRLANNISDELDKAQFDQGPLNTDMGMDNNININNSSKIKYDQPPQYEFNYNLEGGGETFVGQNNNFNQMNNNMDQMNQMNMNMNMNMNTNMNTNMGNMDQTNNRQNVLMNKIIDKLEKQISQLDKDQNISQLMNLIENIRLNENLTKEDVRNLASAIRNLSQTTNNDKKEREIISTTNQNTATQETDIEAFDPASIFLQSVFTFLPLFLIRMALMMHFTLFFVGSVITWVFSIIEVLFDTLLRMAFFCCTPPQVRNKTSQIIEEKISFCFLNFITIIQLALILYFPVFPWFWARKSTENNSSNISTGIFPVTPRNGIAEKEWEHKPLLGRASVTIGFLLGLCLTYGFGAF
ncbi:hypothetical protein M0813_27994 [Anaeramoeba flamelloides]|uniref:Uncharacterized protein n=1 Tax=Anaeramoeba flamelloides TaxID=1746091 RepID=A0ABQ8XVQ3_9EUKA|nr:hypothetical protein M0813_27994 [Anaeramoeba flamelloides]